MPASSTPTSHEPPGGVYLDAALVARLTDALERLGHGYSGGSPGRPDPVRARATRDYDVLRGLLGRAGAPRPLRMRRVKKDNVIVLADTPPVAAVTATVESPGNASTGPLTEHVDITCAPLPNLPLITITAAMPISRVELTDAHGVLVAFGPSLPPAP